MTQEQIEAVAWRLVLGYAESGLEDDIDEDGEYSEEDYDKITNKAWDVLNGLKREHGVKV